MNYTLNIIFDPPLPCGLCSDKATAQLAPGGTLIDTYGGPGPYFLLPVCIACIKNLKTWTMPPLSFPLAVDTSALQHIQSRTAQACHGVNRTGCTGPLARIPSVSLIDVMPLENSLWLAIALCPACRVDALRISHSALPEPTSYRADSLQIG